jgi:hypothetical protein
VSVDFELILDRVAFRLEWLRPPPVFIGGAVVPLHLDDFGRSQARPTKDVDCIVPEIRSYLAFAALEESLRSNGWSPDPEGPICRYGTADGLTVDFMPEDPGALGFAGRWYPETARRAAQKRLVTGREILVASASCLLACKLEAFFDRGVADPLESRDLEDIIALLDGCRGLATGVSRAPEPIRRYIAEGLGRIAGDRILARTLPAHLPRGGDETHRARRLEQTIVELTGRWPAFVLS